MSHASGAAIYGYYIPLDRQAAEALGFLDDYLALETANEIGVIAELFNWKSAEDYSEVAVMRAERIYRKLDGFFDKNYSLTMVHGDSDTSGSEFLKPDMDYIRVKEEALFERIYTPLAAKLKILNVMPKFDAWVTE
jgi:hypothetical protein